MDSFLFETESLVELKFILSIFMSECMARCSIDETYASVYKMIGD
jgi:hypothetical protein